MAGLKEAQEQLERAVARLEEAARRRAAGDAGAQPALDSELAEVRARCAALEGQAREASGRLDRTIARVRALTEA